MNSEMGIYHFEPLIKHGSPFILHISQFILYNSYRVFPALDYIIQNMCVSQNLIGTHHLSHLPFYTPPKTPHFWRKRDFKAQFKHQRTSYATFSLNTKVMFDYKTFLTRFVYVFLWLKVEGVWEADWVEKAILLWLKYDWKKAQVHKARALALIFLCVIWSLFFPLQPFLWNTRKLHIYPIES